MKNLKVLKNKMKNQKIKVKKNINYYKNFKILKYF